MQNPDSNTPLGSPIQLRRYVLALTVLWTFAIAIVLAWELLDERDQVLAEAQSEARGSGIAVPMAPLWQKQLPDIIHRVIGYSGMWLLGLVGIALLSRHLQRQILCRCVAEQRLQEANELLEQRVADRTAELAKTNGDLQNEIAERRRAEQWLLESEQRFRNYFEQGLVGMAILSADRQWIEVNQRLCRMLGYTEHELLLKTWQELTHPDDVAEDDSQFQRLTSGAVRGFVADRRFVRKDGKAFHVALSMQCLKKSDGTIDGILILVQGAPQRA
jgi:PAS domain S-box-containing protein